MMKGLAVVTAVLVCGCDLYFGGDDDPCKAYPAADIAPAYELRDPSTGQCRGFGGGGWCDDQCGPCPAYSEEAQPDWAMCYGQCAGLDEQTCFTTSGCYAAYYDLGTDGPREFWGCWDTAPSGPVQGQCANLDAQQCSRHDDCIAIYQGFPESEKTQFVQCAAEPATYCLSDAECGSDAHCDTTQCHAPPCPDCPNCGVCADVCYGVCVPNNPGTCANIDCGPGYHCEEQCYGDEEMMSSCQPVCVQDLTCASMECAPGYTCAEVCDELDNGHWSCHPTCVPDPNDPGDCTGQVMCAMPAPACPSGTTPGIKNGCYTGYCIPLSQCSPNDPGECYGTVECDALPPQCPSGTVAGVKNGCWSGYCIPEDHCPLAPCETLQSEGACVARMDCMPVYDGQNCTCYPTHCECEVLTYDRCEPL